MTLLQSTTLTATTEEGVDIYYSPDGKFWAKYDGDIEVTANGTWYFKATDAAGNEGTNSITFTNIYTTAPGHTQAGDTEAPVINLSGDTITPLQKSTLTATTEEGVDIFYSMDEESWTKYTDAIDVTANGTWHFKATDAAGNEGTASITFNNIDTVAPLLSSVDIAQAPDLAGLVAISVTATESLSALQASWLNGEWEDVVNNTLSITQNGAVRFRLVDLAGNETVTASYEVDSFNMPVTELETEVSGTRLTLDWSGDASAAWADGYDIVLRGDAGEIALEGMDATGLETFQTPTGELNLSLKPCQSSEWMHAEGPAVIQEGVPEAPQLVQAEGNGMAELMFARGTSVWGTSYLARHVGAGDWTGTRQTVKLAGRNCVGDIFLGSEDATILLLTDDENGDALFVDDVYSAFPDGVDAQARLARIDEIRAGAGNDVIDLTSQRFEHVGNGMTVRGGDGDDVIWATSGDNWLFGDDGVDQIVGAGGNDVIVGGAGDDTLHGGGGDDIFAFGGAWGNDTVEQLATGKVTLWFREGDDANAVWNAEASTLTYTHGDSSVTVKGVGMENITLRYGDNGSGQYGDLLAAGAFDAFTSQKVFEDKGMLA